MSTENINNFREEMQKIKRMANTNRLREEIQKPQRREIDFSLSDMRVVDDDKRIVELSFSSEMPVPRWFGDEILSHKSGACRLDRINSTGCLLFNHDRNRVIGKIIKAQIKNRRGIATVQFDTDEDSAVIYNKVKSGTLRGVSVGYIIIEMERRSKKVNGVNKDTYTVTAWEPTEISIVSVPADISVGVGRSIIEADEETAGSLNRFKRQLKINENFYAGGRK